MTDDLVTQLREYGSCGMVFEAADRIEKLEAVTKDDAKWLAAYHKWCEMNGCAPSSSDLIIARQALENEDVRLNSRADLDGDYYHERIEKLEALVEQLRDDNSSIMDSFDEDFLRQDDRIEKLEAALRSIAANACCDSCREAALVARKALEGKDE